MNITDLQQIDALLQKRLRGFATKDDLKTFATKHDIKELPTKDDLKTFATKDDLKNFATKHDLTNFATKDDLKKELAKYPTKTDLQRALDDAVGEIVEIVDKHKADKLDVQQLEKRIDLLEQKIAA